MSRNIVIATTMVLALFSWSCELRDAGCVSDQECRQGRFCQSGVCTGDVDIDTDDNASTNNDGANNDGANNDGNNGGGNNPPNNTDMPNADPNNTVNNGNGDPNATTNNSVNFCETTEDCDEDEFCDPDASTCEFACEEAEDCDAGEVCSGHDEVEVAMCVAPENCEFSGGFGSEESCGYAWACGDSEKTVECRFEGEDGICSCFSEDGDVVDFVAERDFCFDELSEAVDTVNVECGWALPVRRDR